METQKYWIFQTNIITWRNHPVQAKLIDPLARNLVALYGSYGFRSETQNQPYGVAPDLTYQVNPRHPHPDNYFQSAGFTLYSERLVDLLKEYGVKAEVFPVKMVDKAGSPLSSLKYFIFHLLEGVIDAIDVEKSSWIDDRTIGVPRLVLREGFEPRPMFKCDRIFLRLMRDDLRQEIRQHGITGFAFLAPEHYRSGQYGQAPAFED
jgi:hypothetical protein